MKGDATLKLRLERAPAHGASPARQYCLAGDVKFASLRRMARRTAVANRPTGRSLVRREAALGMPHSPDRMPESGRRNGGSGNRVALSSQDTAARASVGIAAGASDGMAVGPCADTAAAQRSADSGPASAADTAAGVTDDTADRPCADTAAAEMSADTAAATSAGGTAAGTLADTAAAVRDDTAVEPCADTAGAPRLA